MSGGAHDSEYGQKQEPSTKQISALHEVVGLTITTCKRVCRRKRTGETPPCLLTNLGLPEGVRSVYGREHQRIFSSQRSVTQVV